MMTKRFDLTGRPQFILCIRTTNTLTVLGEMSDPVAALLHGKAEVWAQVNAGMGSDIVSVEVLNSSGEIVLGEMAVDILVGSPDVSQAA